MPEYSNENRGALFRADKAGNEKRPDYTGKLNVNGADFRVSAWIKEAKSGAKFMSLSVEPDTPREKAKPRREEAPDGDIPF